MFYRPESFLYSNIAVIIKELQKINIISLWSNKDCQRTWMMFELKH